MHKLCPPDFSALDVLDNASAHAEPIFAQKLRAPKLRVSVNAAEQHYARCIQSGAAYRVPQSGDVAGVLDKDEAFNVYEGMRKLPFRHATAAELLFRNARLTKCAYCGHNRPQCLDHYLPKYRYVEYVFSPMNLVPACDSCNTFAGGKGKILPKSAGEFFYHPYFDDPDDGRWLIVDMSVAKGYLEVRFDTQRPEKWSADKFARIDYTFKKLKLSAMYSEAVLSDISSRRTVLRRLFDEQGGVGLAAHFGSIAADYMADDPNGWIFVAYEYFACHQSICEDFKIWL